LVIPPGETFPLINCDGEKAIPNNGDGVWRWEVEQYKQKKEYLSFKKTTRSPLLTSTGEKAHWNVYTKSYFCEKESNGNIPTELLLDFINRSGTKELKNLNINFSFPKPSALISYLIQITNKRNDITILDFFAGSGTTGHAVMRLNAEDGGKRNFILCTNNESNICRDITYERIKRVIDKEGYAASLKYYKVDYIPISERMYYEYADDLLYHIKELVELENGVNFTGNIESAIVLTEEELDDFIFHIDENCKKLYLGYDILMDAQQAQILKDRKITINIIPDYYYKELEG
jgi:adenine-specific DNA-methyltransferase